MKFKGFIGCRVEYLKFIGDGGDYSANFDKYELSDVIVREVFAFDPEAVEQGYTTLYFISERSKCFDENGNESVFPRPSAGDMCVLRSGSEEERTLRIAEAGYFIGRGDIEYTRLKLR